jgi:hypothetical protein
LLATITKSMRCCPVFSCSAIYLGPVLLGMAGAAAGVAAFAGLLHLIHNRVLRG